MFNRTEIRKGMTTRSVDGEKLGKIVAMDDYGFTVEKGIFFKKDYLIRYDEITGIEGDEVQLASQASQLHEAGEGAQAAKGTEAGLGGSERGWEASREAAGARGEPTGISEETRVPVAEEELEVTKQRRPVGEVHVHKDVVTETKQVQVPVTREEVRVERIPATPGMEAPGAGATIQEEDINIPVMEEEIEIHKRPVVKEEVRVTKEVYQEQRAASAVVRREDVHVEGTGRVRQTREEDPNKRR
jgi:uncharacterized protein (TIGR02271 family)